MSSKNTKRKKLCAIYQHSMRPLNEMKKRIGMKYYPEVTNRLKPIYRAHNIMSGQNIGKEQDCSQKTYEPKDKTQ